MYALTIHTLCILYIPILDDKHYLTHLQKYTVSIYSLKYISNIHTDSLTSNQIQTTIPPKPWIVIQKIIPLIIYLVLQQFVTDQSHAQRSLAISENVKKRRVKDRTNWSVIDPRISDDNFRRMFHMSREFFNLFCLTIVSKTGEKEFKSEAYINIFLTEKAKYKMLIM